MRGNSKRKREKEKKAPAQEVEVNLALPGTVLSVQDAPVDPMHSRRIQVTTTLEEEIDSLRDYIAGLPEDLACSAYGDVYRLRLGQLTTDPHALPRDFLTLGHIEPSDLEDTEAPVEAARTVRAAIDRITDALPSDPEAEAAMDRAMAEKSTGTKRLLRVPVDPVPSEPMLAAPLPADPFEDALRAFSEEIRPRIREVQKNDLSKYLKGTT